MPGPNSLPTTKYAMVDINMEPARKCTKMNMSDSLTIDEKAGVYARPQAKAVSRRKNERR
jgi:hypothetical protein